MIEIKKLNKTYKTGNSQYKSKGHIVEALHDVSLTINDGDIYGIIGLSGAGKSTLVRCINYLEKPTSGEVIINGQKLSALSEKELRNLRRDVTMIFQSFNLLMQSTCIKNIMFPLELVGEDKNKAEQRARELLKIVGLEDKANSYPAQLSGGQQQRIAIARALASNPKILLCDEATSALDPQTTNSILELIRDINNKLGITVVVITHQMSVVESICNKVAILDEGRVVEEGDVAEVFSHPKSLAAKRLVFPEIEASSKVISETKQQILRVVFNGSASAGKPLIASLAIDMKIAANIIYASIKNINEKTYGSLLLGIKNKKESSIAKKYLNAVDGVNVEEFSIDE